MVQQIQFSKRKKIWNVLTINGTIVHSQLQQALEEKEDELFISSMRKLHVEEQDVRNIIAWREIYTYLEKCADACEHVADIVGSVAMKNS